MNTIATLKNKKSKKGFTHVELLVTISIFVLLTIVVVFSQNGFNNTVILNDLAYDVALTVRQAQTYGVGVRGNVSASGESFQSYGLYFNLNDPTLGIYNFLVFTNPNANWPTNPFFGNPNGGSTLCQVGDSQCVQKYNVKNGIKISSICVGSGPSSCTSKPLLYILFKRPKPDALIYYSDTFGGNPTPQNYARIILSSASGATTSVVITSPGQIYVSNQ
jgi:type II secretory pathway pseudopilin PulG